MDKRTKSRKKALKKSLKSVAIVSAVTCSLGAALTTTQNVVYADSEIGIVNKNWQPEGSIVAQGEDGVSWELYENGYLLFKPVNEKNNLSKGSWQKHKYKVKAIGFTDKTFAPVDSSDLFKEFINLDYFDGSNFDTSKVTNMSGLFSGATDLTNIDVSNWDTSKVTNMSSVFAGLNKLEKLDVSKWNVNNVIDLSYMFTGMSKIKRLELGNWNTSNVENMTGVFSSTDSLSNLDIENWNTSNVIYMREMFHHNHALKSLNLSKWNTSNVIYMTDMFQNATGLETLDLSGWNTSNVKNMLQMFQGASNLKDIKLKNWNVSSAQEMRMMFDGTNSLEELDLSGWNLVKVENQEEMFNNMMNLKKLIIGENFKGKNYNGNLFRHLDSHNYKDVYTKKWLKEDKSAGPYTIEEWDKAYKENPQSIAGVWVREEFVKSNEENKQTTVNFVTKTTEEIPEVKAMSNTSINLPTPTVDKPGYSFSGWSKIEGESEKQIFKDVIDIADGEKNITLYAVWDKVNNVSKEQKVIEKTTVYKSDDTLDKGQTKTIEGKNGLKEITTTYKITPITGEYLDENPIVEEKVVTEMIPTVITVGTKPKIEKTEIPLTVKYEKDYTREKGKPNLIIEKGESGSKTITTTYTVDPKTGEITEKVGDPVIVNPGEKIIRVPAKDKIERTEIPASVIYKKDPKRPKGKPNLIIEGISGSKTITTKYTVNPKTGEITEKVSSPLIRVPLRNKVIYVPAKDEIEIIKEEGKTIERTTSYDVDSKTGKLIPKVTDKVITSLISNPNNSDETNTPNKVDNPSVVNDKLEYTGPLSTNTPIDDKGDLITPPIVEKPEYKESISTNTPVDEKGDLITPPIVEKPEYKESISTNTPVDEKGDLITPPIVEKPEYKESISTNTPVDEKGDLITPPIVEKPEYKSDSTETSKDKTTKEETDKTKEELKDKELPNTNSTSILASFVSSVIGTLGLGYKSKRKK